MRTRLQGRPSLQRDGPLSLVNLEGFPGATVQSRLDEIGIGRYHWIVLAGIGGALMSESLEMGSVAPMHTAFSRVYRLTHQQRAALPAVTFAGSGIGLLIAGPICDWRGRKTALVLSLVIIAGVMFATALLPGGTPAEVLLLLRFLSGLAGAIQVPAGLVLAVESCPIVARSRLVFGIQMMGCMGYLLEAIGVQFLMPQFGEASADHWRAFCFLIGCSALAVLPLTLSLYESPSFLAVKGDAEGCVEVLEGIAQINGAPVLQQEQIQHSISSSSISPTSSSQKQLGDVAKVMWAAVTSYWGLLMLLSVIDSSRSFFVSGSSYLWKDLFRMAQGHTISPASLNIIASIAPLIGLAVSQRFLWLGVRRVTFLSAAIATCSLAVLTNEHMRTGALPVLACVMATKLTYGPLNTCIALIKAESFPTEIRVTAYSLISVVSKVTCTLAPTLIEVWKGNERAASWRSGQLLYYFACLMGSVSLSGLLTLAVPGRSGDGRPLNDYFEEKRVQRLPQYGSFGNIWELNKEEEEPGASPSKFHRSKTSPTFLVQPSEEEGP